MGVGGGGCGAAGGWRNDAGATRHDGMGGNYERRYVYISKNPEQKPCEEARTPRGDVRQMVEMSGRTLLGFGVYRDWIYGEITTEKPGYVEYSFSESEDVSKAQKKPTDWAKLPGLGIGKDAIASSSPSK